jgi:hypothetical protein
MASITVQNAISQRSRATQGRDHWGGDTQGHTKGGIDSLAWGVTPFQQRLLLMVVYSGLLAMINIQGTRESIGLSRLRLAHLAGVPVFKLFEAERGVRPLTAEQVAAVLAVLQTEVSRLAACVKEFEDHKVLA